MVYVFSSICILITLFLISAAVQFLVKKNFTSQKVYEGNLVVKDSDTFKFYYISVDQYLKNKNRSFLFSRRTFAALKNTESCMWAESSQFIADEYLREININLFPKH